MSVFSSAGIQRLFVCLSLFLCVGSIKQFLPDTDNDRRLPEELEYLFDHPRFNGQYKRSDSADADTEPSDNRNNNNNNGNSKDDSNHNECRSRVNTHSRYGQWASKGNSTTNHLSLLTPTSPQMNLIDEALLHQQPVFAGEEHCPHQPVTDGDATTPLMNSALCPWYWKVNFDPDRIPMVLPEAHCRCNSSVTGHKLFSCKEVTMQLRVLKLDRNCNQLDEDTINLAVACVSTLQPKKTQPESEEEVVNYVTPYPVTNDD